MPEFKPNLAEQAEFDGDFWNVFLDFPYFGDCEVTYEYDYETEDLVLSNEPCGSETTIRVLIEGQTVIPEQEVAWRSLVSNPEKLKSQTLLALAREGRRFADRVLNLSPRRIEHHFRGQGIEQMVALCGINIHERQPDGSAWFSLDFCVGWDEEHGASVLWGPGGIKAVGGSSEFTCRGSTVAAHARCISST